jgi:hypothetical protein
MQEPAPRGQKENANITQTHLNGLLTTITQNLHSSEATQELEIRRMEVQGHLGKIVHETLSRK